MSNLIHYMGIDPGTNGAAVLLGPTGRALGRFMFESAVVDKELDPSLLVSGLASLLYEHTSRWDVAVEKVHAMPKQGVASSFKFGRAYGLVLGVVASLQPDRYLHPTASRWKRDMGLTSDKEQSRAAAIAAFPEQAQWFARKKDADVAEAALLAEWARRRP